ncbi:MAG TPA: FtsK/SpoIIIE domain-containing protein, partial [Actinoplanes sp.]
SAVPFGLLDDPAAQSQPMAVLDLAGTNRLLVAGGPQSGRTTVARTLITSVAGRFGPEQAHLYVLENRPAGLSGYAELPHCGAVLSAAEPDRIRRFVTWLDSEVQRRTVARFAVTGEPDPWILVIIDGWEYFENRGDPNFIETSMLGTVRAIITAGPPVGVHVVAIGGQDMMSGKVPGLYSHRILLPFPKEDIRKQSLTGPMVPPPVLPGRAIDAGNGLHLQVAQAAGTPADLVAQRRDRPTDTHPPRRFPPIPARIALADLAVPEVAPSPTWIPLGVGGPDVVTLGVDLFEAGPHLMLVSGPGGSGRTTAAATVAHGLRRIDVGVLALAPPRSPLRTLLPDDAGVRVLSGTTLKDADLRTAVEAFGDGPYAVIIDDCEQITVTPTQEGFSEAPTLLQDIAGPGALGRQALIMCGDATPILEGQRRSLMRIVNEIMTAGTRLLLTPTSVPVARTHGFTLERDQFFAGPPGRGHLTTGRGATIIQLAVVRAA